MILFLYGEENFLAYQKLLDIKKKYIDASLGTTNLVELDGMNLDYKTFARQVLTLPFLAKTRLVIINNLLSVKKKNLLEQITNFLAEVPKTTVLVFYEDKMPDKRSALYKKLVKIATCQEFKKFSLGQLENWVQKKINNIDKNVISERELVDLLVHSSEDMWRISNDIEKIRMFLYENKTATIDDVKLLVTCKLQDNIFVFLDFLAKQKMKESLTTLHDLLDLRVNELYILTMIVYQFRQLLMVCDLLSAGNNAMQVARISGINSYVVNKNLFLAKKYSNDRLKKIYLQLLKTDESIKAGKIDAKLALDLLVVNICH